MHVLELHSFKLKLILWGNQKGRKRGIAKRNKKAKEKQATQIMCRVTLKVEWFAAQ